MQYKSYLVEQDIEIVDEYLILFYGENLGLKEDLKKKVRLKNKDSEIITFYEDQILRDENLIFNEIGNISLFMKEKIYFIDQVSDKILDKIKDIAKIVGKQKIYFFSDVLDKRSKLRSYFEKSNQCASIACYVDNELSIKKIILEKLKGFEGLSPQNINLILENCNLDRAKLNNEIEKIKSYFINKKIQTEKLENILNIKTNDKFSSLQDEALKGNRLLTNRLLSDTIMSADKSVYYLGLINQRLNKILEVKSSNESNLEKSINNLRPPIFWKDKPNFILQTKKWNQDKIRILLKEIYNLEIKIKSETIINKNILMKKLVVDICELANT